MNARRTFVFLLLFLATSALAQESTFFSETVDVHVINVDVIVTDRNGKPVPGLSKDDFEVFENGDKREVTNFYEFRASTLPATSTVEKPGETAALPSSGDVRPRRIVLFIDDATTQPNHRAKLLSLMKDFVRTTVRPGDAVLIARWKPGLEIVQQFTAEPAVTLAKLDELEKTSATGAIVFSSELKQTEDHIRAAIGDYSKSLPGGGVQKPPIAEGVTRASIFAARTLHLQHQKKEAMKSLLASLRGVEGRKVMVFVTELLTERPAQPVYEFLESIKDSFEGGEFYRAEESAREYSDPNLVADLSTAANSSGVTMYAIDAGGLGATTTVNAEDRGSGGTGFMTAPETRMQDMRAIAVATGGTAVAATNNFKIAFDTIASDLQSYYSLGYRATGARQDVVRSIDVKLKKKGYTVRTRKAFVEKSLAAEMADAVAANLFYAVTKNDIGIKLAVGTPKESGTERPVVPVEVKIPTSALTLIPDGTDLKGSFSTFAAFVRADGAVSEVTRQQHQLRFPASSLKRRPEITLKLDVTIDPKTEGVSIGVMDDLSQSTGFATGKI